MKHLWLLLVAVSGYGAVLNTTGTPTDCQTQVTAASSGDTVLFPASGSFSWSSGVTVPNSKSITIDGNNSAIVHSGGYTGNLFAQSGAGSATNHFTRFVFNGTDLNPDFTFDGGFTNAWFWVDKCTFSCPNNPAIFIYVYQSWGLINSNIFAAPSNSEMIHNQAWNPSQQTNGWTDDILQSSIYAVYIENNKFTNNMTFGNPAFFFGNSAVQAYYGAHTVCRSNTFSMSQIDNHGGAVGLLGGREWDIYENDFYLVANAGDFCFSSGVGKYIQ